MASQFALKSSEPGIRLDSIVAIFYSNFIGLQVQRNGVHWFLGIQITS